MSRRTTIECEADVDIFDLALSELSAEDQLALAHELLTEAGTAGVGSVRGTNGAPVTIEQICDAIAAAIGREDGEALASLLHRLCFDVAGQPIIHQLHVRPLRAMEVAA